MKMEIAAIKETLRSKFWKMENLGNPIEITEISITNRIEEKKETISKFEDILKEIDIIKKKANLKCSSEISPRKSKT